MKKHFIPVFIALVSVLISGAAKATTYYSAASGNWNASVWSLSSGGALLAAGTYPTTGDAVIMDQGWDITVNINVTVASVQFASNNTNNNLTINTGITLTVTGDVSYLGDATANQASALTGPGTLSCANLYLGSTTDISPTGARTLGVTVTTATINVSNNVILYGWQGNNTSRLSNPTLTMTSGTLSVAGQIYAQSETGLNTAALVLGSSNPTLNLQNASPWGAFTGTFTRTLNGTGATVNYNGYNAQSILATTYTNLAVTNNGTKSLTGATTLTGLIVANGTLDLSNNSITATTTTIYTGTNFSSTILSSGSGVLTLGGNVTVSDSATGTAVAAISCPITLSATRQFTVADNASMANEITVSGKISGAFGVTKAGNGEMVLSGANDYTGAVTVSAGVLNLQNDLGAGTVAGGVTVASGAALELEGSISVGAETLTINNTGVSSGGCLRSISGTNTWAGAITISTNASRINCDAGTLTLSNTASVASTNLGITFGGAGNISVSGTTNIGSAALAKDGTGTLTLSGSSTYTGATNISNGVLKLGAAGSGGNTPVGTTGTGVTVTTGGTFDLNGITLSTAEGVSLTGTGYNSLGSLTNSSSTAVTYSGQVILGGAASIVASSGNIGLTATGTLSGTGFTLTLDGTATGCSLASIVGNGSGGIIKTGTGTWSLTNASNSYTGTTAINGGTLSITSDGNLGNTSATVTFNGGILSTSGTISTSRSVTMTGSGGLDVSSNTLTWSGTISGSGGITKTGAGTLVLGGSNTSYSGTTTISAGTVSISADNNIGTGSLTMSGGTLLSTATISSSRNVTLTTSSSSTFNVNTGVLTLSGIISGGGNLVKDGTGVLTLSNTGNTYSGTTTLSQASISISADGCLGTPPSSPTSGSITMSSGTSITTTASFTLNSNRGIASTSGSLSPGNTTTLVYGGIITGSAVSKAGQGTLTLSGANTVSSFTLASGTVNINAAQALGTGSVTFSFGSIDNTSGSTVTMSNTSYAVNADISFAGTNSLSFGTGAVTLGASRIFTVTANTLTIGGAIGDGGSAYNITKAGNGTLVLSGTNTYTGITTINAGIVSISSDAALGTAPGAVTAGKLVLNGGTLSTTGSFTLNSNRGISASATSTIDVINGVTITYGGIIAGSGGITKTSTGTLILAGVNTYSGATTITAGTVQISADNNLGTAPVSVTAGSIVLNGGTLATTSSFTLNSNRGISLTAASKIDAASGTTLSYSGIIAGSFGLSKENIGTLTLGGANTFSGGLTLNAGTLNINNATAVGSGTFTVNAGTIDNTSGGSITLTNNNALVWNSDFTFSGSNALNLGTGNLSLSGNTQATVSGSTLTVGGSISGSNLLTKAGAGALTLSGSNSFSGGVTLSAGTLNINNASAIGTGTFTINGGTIDNTSGGTITNSNNNAITLGADFTYTGSNALNLGTGTITMAASRQVTVSGSTLTMGGTLSASGSNFTKAGVGTFAFGSNPVTVTNLTISAGTLTATSGTLTIGGDFSNSGTFTHNSGTVLFNKSGAQNIGTATFNNLTTSGSGTKTATGALGVASVLTVGSGTTLDMSTNALSGASLTTSGTGTLTTSNTSTTPLPTGRTWTMDVQFIAAGSAQNVPAGTFATLTIGGSGNVFRYMVGNISVATLNLTATTLRTTDNANSGKTLTITSAINRTGGSISSSLGAVTFANTTSDLTIPSSTFLTASTVSITGGKKVLIGHGVGLQNISISSLTTSTTGSYFSINDESLTLTGTVTMATGTGLSGSKASTLVVGSGSTNVNLGTLRMEQTTPGTTNALLNFTIGTTGGGSLTLGDSIRIVNTFQPPSSSATGNFTFTTGNKLIFESRSTGTGRLAEITSGTFTISGNIVAERYVKNKTDKRRYVMVASPVDNISIRNAWQDDIFITAPGSGGTPCGSGTGNGGATDKYNSNGYDATTANLYTLYTYSQVSGWQGIGTNTTTTTLSKGVGYRVLYRGSRGTNDANCSSLLNSSSPNLPDSTVMNVTGTPTTGDVTVSIYGPGGSSYGYTLLGNPYPSEISWNKFFAGNPLLEDMYYTHDPNSSATNGYLAYSAGVVTGSSGNTNTSGVITGSNGDAIASGQAFLIRVKSGNVTGSGYQSTVTFKETHKTTSAQLGVFRGTDAGNSSPVYAWKNMVRINFSTNSDTYIDDVVVRYSSDNTITTAPNGKLDVNTLNSVDFLATMKSTFSYAIQTRPILFTDDTVPVRVVSSVTGDFKLTFSEYEHFDSAAQILLIDAFTGVTTDIKQNPVYPFSITSNTASQGTSRFTLVFRSLTSVMPVSFLSISAKAKNEGAAVTWKVAFEQKVKEYAVERSVDGKTFNRIGTMASKGDSNSPVEYSYNDQQPLNGTVYYRVKSIEASGAVTYSSIVDVNGSKQSFISVYPNPAKDQLRILLSYNAPSGMHPEAVIRNLQGKVVFTQPLPGFNGNFPINIQALAAGVYIVSVNLPDGSQAVSKFVRQ